MPSEREPAEPFLQIVAGDSGADWEALNGLMMAERRQRIDTAKRQRLADFQRGLRITLDTETTAQLWSATQRLAERFRLTVYDAVYLELAQRRILPLATLDQEMRTAGAALGVTDDPAFLSSEGQRSFQGYVTYSENAQQIAILGSSKGDYEY